MWIIDIIKSISTPVFRFDQLMVSRQTYFPLVIDRVQRHFQDFVSTSLKANEVWLDYNGTPLKWYYPVGLLFDLYANEGNGASANIPWVLTIHFDNYPSNLIHSTNKDMTEAYFMSTLKEADAIKHKGKVIKWIQLLGERKDHL